MGIINYCKASYEELVHKVSWPSGKELMSSAVVVLIASICIALFIFAIDTIFKYGMEFIYHLAN